VAVITGVSFQGRGLPRYCVKGIFRERGRGVLDLEGRGGGSASPSCVKGKGDADNAPYRASMALCGITDQNAPVFRYAG
jgi:hypothetical protein